MSLNIKDLLSFNSVERNGIIILIALIILVSLLPGILGLFEDEDYFDAVAFEKEIERFEKEQVGVRLASADTEIVVTNAPKHSGHSGSGPLFQFDPNTLPDEGWKSLGMSEAQVRVIRNYLSKGGIFRRKEDLKRVYSISASQYLRLEPFIVIPSIIDHYKGANANVTSPVSEIQLTDVNAADSLTLLKIKGIGPAFARRIIRYRELLGGFYSVSQLKEIYGFDDDKYQSVAGSFITGNGPYRKYELNTFTSEEIRKHPYFDKSSIKAMIDRRIINGNFRDISEVALIEGIAPDQFERFKHYLYVKK